MGAFVSSAVYSHTQSFACKLENTQSCDEGVDCLFAEGLHSDDDHSEGHSHKRGSHSHNCVSCIFHKSENTVVSVLLQSKDIVAFGKSVSPRSSYLDALFRPPRV